MIMKPYVTRFGINPPHACTGEKDCFRLFNKLYNKLLVLYCQGLLLLWLVFEACQASTSVGCSLYDSILSCKADTWLEITSQLYSIVSNRFSYFLWCVVLKTAALLYATSLFFSFFEMKPLPFCGYPPPPPMEILVALTAL